MNLNFWYGSVMHEGFENLLLHGLPKALVAMNKESKSRMSQHRVDADTMTECDLQMRIMKTLIKAAARQPFMERLSLDWAERRFELELDNGLIYCSTVDGKGQVDEKDVMFEIKTAKQVNNFTFKALSMDQQIHGYAHQMKEGGEGCPSKVAYCIFRKSSKYLKKGQSADSFVEEIKTDIQKRPSWYFITGEDGKTFPYIHSLGRKMIASTGYDMEAMSSLLLKHYDVDEDELLLPDHWPKNCRHCLNYGCCQFLPLCQNISKYKLHLRGYQGRELRYPSEKLELKGV